MKRKHVLLIGGISYLVFVIYGSLVPLDFRARPLAEAWEAFRHLRYLELAVVSRADWVANLLLFIPLAFLGLGVLWHGTNLLLRLSASILIFISCAGLSLGIEFAQIFFPPRTVSLNDVLAETIGAGTGIILWWMFGPPLAQWFSSWSKARDVPGIAQRLLYLYLFLLFAYNLLPLDLTLSPVEIYHKWKAGRLVFIPFSFPQKNIAEFCYGLMMDIAIWIPVGFLRRLHTRHSASRIMMYVTGASLFLEFLQLFVFTRVSDVTDVLTAAAGGGLGILFASRLNLQSPAQTGMKKETPSVFSISYSFAAGLGLLFLSYLAALVVFWYPFNFNLEPAFVRPRLGDFLNEILFSSFYFSTEYRAATEVLHKIIFFIPAGIFSAFISGLIRHSGWRLLWNILAVSGILAAGFAVELGQVLLPGKFPSLTDSILEIAGGLLGLIGYHKISRIFRPADLSSIARE